MRNRNSALLAAVTLSACGFQNSANSPSPSLAKDSIAANNSVAAIQASPDPGEIHDTGLAGLKTSYNDLHFTTPPVQPDKFAVGEQFKIRGESTQPEVEFFISSTRPGGNQPSKWIKIGTAPVVNGKWEFNSTLAAVYRDGNNEIQIGAPVDSWQWGFVVRGGEFVGWTGQALSVLLPCSDCAWEKFDTAGERPPLISR